MRPDRRVDYLVWVSIAGMWVVAFWHLSRASAQALPWLLPVIVTTALWTLVEWGPGQARHPVSTLFLRIFMAWVATALAALMSVQAMATIDAVSAWASAGSRGTGLVLATGLIVFGNALPTLAAPETASQLPATWQHLRRFVAWTLVLMGLGVGASWIMLDPIAASRVTNRLLALGFLLICGRQVVAYFARPGSRTPTQTRLL